MIPKSWQNIVDYYRECVVTENTTDAKFWQGDDGKGFFIVRGKEEAISAGHSAIIVDEQNPKFKDFMQGTKWTAKPTKYFYGFPLHYENKKIYPLIVFDVELKQTPNGRAFELQSDSPRLNVSLPPFGITEEEKRQAVEAFGDGWDEGKSLWDNVGEALKRVGEIAPPLRRKDLLSKPFGVLFHQVDSTFTRGLEQELTQLSGKSSPNNVWKCILSRDSSPAGINLQDKDILEITPLNDAQRNAVKSAFVNPLTVVTGPPGTGKSQVILNVVANALLHNQTVLFGSKNRQAVNVVVERLGDVQSRPIMLKYDNSGGNGAHDFAEKLQQAVTAAASYNKVAIDREIKDCDKQLADIRSNEMKIRGTLDKVVTRRNCIEVIENELKSIAGELSLHPAIEENLKPYNEIGLAKSFPWQISHVRNLIDDVIGYEKKLASVANELSNDIAGNLDPYDEPVVDGKFAQKIEKFAGLIESVAKIEDKLVSLTSGLSPAVASNLNPYAPLKLDESFPKKIKKFAGLIKSVAKIEDELVSLTSGLPPAVASNLNPYAPLKLDESFPQKIKKFAGLIKSVAKIEDELVLLTSKLSPAVASNLNPYAPLKLDESFPQKIKKFAGLIESVAKIEDKLVSLTSGLSPAVTSNLNPYAPLKLDESFPQKIKKFAGLIESVAKIEDKLVSLTSGLSPAVASNLNPCAPLKLDESFPQKIKDVKHLSEGFTNPRWFIKAWRMGSIVGQVHAKKQLIQSMRELLEIMPVYCDSLPAAMPADARELLYVAETLQKYDAIQAELLDEKKKYDTAAKTLLEGLLEYGAGLHAATPADARELLYVAETLQKYDAIQAELLDEKSKYDTAAKTLLEGLLEYGAGLSADTPADAQELLYVAETLQEYGAMQAAELLDEKSKYDTAAKTLLEGLPEYCADLPAATLADARELLCVAETLQEYGAMQAAELLDEKSKYDTAAKTLLEGLPEYCAGLHAATPADARKLLCVAETLQEYGAMQATELLDEKSKYDTAAKTLLEGLPEYCAGLHAATPADARKLLYVAKILQKYAAIQAELLDAKKKYEQAAIALRKMLPPYCPNLPVDTLDGGRMLVDIASVLHKYSACQRELLDKVGAHWREDQQLETLRTRLDQYQEKVVEFNIRRMDALTKRRLNSLPDCVRHKVLDYADYAKWLAIKGGALKKKENAFKNGVVPAIPAMAVTNLSVRRVPPLQPDVFDLVVIDEASQCDIASALPMLYRGKRALVIGDRMQLTHISKLNDSDATRLLEEFELTSEPRFEYKGNSLFDLADASVGKASNFILNEHYRSKSEIIEFSNREFYGNVLNVYTDYRKLRAVNTVQPPVQWHDVEGNTERPSNGGAFNDAEVKGVVSVLQQIIERTSEKGEVPSIGVVTPFRTQANRIRNLATRIIPDAQLTKIGFMADTAHSYQGDEKDIMIFSPVISKNAHSGTRWFLQNNRNLFNVAITRARTELHIVGDKAACENSDISYLSNFVQYVEELGAPNGAIKPKDRFDSSWEGEFYDALKQVGITCLPQYSVDQYKLDLAIPDAKIDIEVDGAYWHKNLDGSRVLSDLKRDTHLASRGWNIKRFWVYELQSDMDRCVNRVSAAVEDASGNETERIP